MNILRMYKEFCLKYNINMEANISCRNRCFHLYRGLLR